ncbi:phosphotransferase [Rouxiella badensis]|uniref:phosphotransferase n=1 Tax=Rouxiella badensis TaxID=1646377 RepID=UPI001D15476D|nr:phosphotransferase [Rouxiella badensis]MCC3701271.1 phosphotransferase [Rouxiella badensis]
MKLSGLAAVPFKINSSLRSLVEKHLPADYSAGCVFTPVEGLSSESWRIESPTHRYLARLESAEKQLLWIDRRRENRLLRHLSSTGIAPQVLRWAYPWLVVSWVDGETLSQALFFSAEQQRQLAALLARLHGVAPQGEVLDIRRRLGRYWQAIDRRRLTPAWLRVHQRMMKRSPPKALKTAVTHMDIHPENGVVSPQGTRLIDWEYAVSADIALEFAALFRGNGYSPSQQSQLLLDYARCGGYPDLVRLEAQIRLWQPWLDYLMLMWFEVRWQQTADARYTLWAQPLRQQLFSEFQ